MLRPPAYLLPAAILTLTLSSRALAGLKVLWIGVREDGSPIALIRISPCAMSKILRMLIRDRRPKIFSRPSVPTVAFNFCRAFANDYGCYLSAVSQFFKQDAPSEPMLRAATAIARLFLRT